MSGESHGIKYLLIALSVVGFLIPAFHVPLSEALGVDPQAILIGGFSIGAGLFALTAWLEFHSIHVKIERSRRSLEWSVRNRRDFINEGDANSALKKIAGRFARAAIVNNVYIPFASRPNIYFALCDKERIGNINRFLAREGAQKYTEVVSRDAYLEVRDSYRQLIADPRGKFDLRVTNRIFPVLNFIIFEYANSQAEVLFGWGGYANLNTAKVYSTTEPDVVNMFQEIFSTLTDVSGIVGSSPSVIGRLEVYLGYWIDVSRVPDDAGGLKFANAALLEFHMDHARKTSGEEARLAVKGLAFDLEDQRSPGRVLREFSSTSCEMRGSRVYVSHRSSDPGCGGIETESFGQSMYEFGRLAATGRMYGTIFAPNPLINSEERAISTICVKLPASLAKNIAEIWSDGAPATDLAALRTLIAPEIEKLVRETATKK